MSSRWEPNRLAIAKETTDIVSKEIKETCHDIWMEAFKELSIHVDTGETIASLRVRDPHPDGPRRLTGEVEAQSKGAVILQSGAKKHVIKARGRYMKFYWERVGHIVYFKKVRHPGFKKVRYLQDPLKLIGRRRGYLVTLKVGSQV